MREYINYVLVDSGKKQAFLSNDERVSVLFPEIKTRKMKKGLLIYKDMFVHKYVSEENLSDILKFDDEYILENEKKQTIFVDVLLTTGETINIHVFECPKNFDFITKGKNANMYREELLNNILTKNIVADVFYRKR